MNFSQNQPTYQIDFTAAEVEEILRAHIRKNTPRRFFVEGGSEYVRPVPEGNVKMTVRTRTDTHRPQELFKDAIRIAWD